MEIGELEFEDEISVDVVLYTRNRKLDIRTVLDTAVLFTRIDN